MPRQVNDTMADEVGRNEENRQDAARRREAGAAPAAPESDSPRLSQLPVGAAPSRQLRRVGVKIGRKVLEFQRPVFRLGPLWVYRTASGRLSLQWKRSKR